MFLKSYGDTERALNPRRSLPGDGQEFRPTVPERLNVAHVGSASTAGGGEWCGLCISLWAVCSGSEPCNMSPLPLLFICPHTPPQPAIIYDQLFKMLPPLPLVT